MNINDIVKVGESCIKEYIVMPDDTADFLGNKGVEVLSTPSMIKYIEQTASQIIFDRVPGNYSPVGTKIDVKHINSTPVNAKITVKTKIIEIKNKRVSYNAEVFNEKDKIGFGTYDLHVIDLEKFLNKN